MDPAAEPRIDACYRLGDHLREVATTRAYQAFEARHRSRIETAALAALVMLANDSAKYDREYARRIRHGIQSIARGDAEPCCMHSLEAHTIYGHVLAMLAGCAYLAHNDEQLDT